MDARRTSSSCKSQNLPRTFDGTKIGFSDYEISLEKGEFLNINWLDDEHIFKPFCSNQLYYRHIYKYHFIQIY